MKSLSGDENLVFFIFPGKETVPKHRKSLKNIKSLQIFSPIFSANFIFLSFFLQNVRNSKNDQIFDTKN